ncbi:uncharacterized protein [Ptychodera flava]|uniref:uncharacterized protein isoform X2 n=1 Tax=Ptychodera flava TaxID=63121 RepID=UPI00396A3295
MRLYRASSPLSIAIFVSVGFLLAKLSGKLNGNLSVASDERIQTKHTCPCPCDRESSMGRSKGRPQHQASEKKEQHTEPARKFFIDCGGNVASSVVLFHEMYPDASEYFIHSFELDDRLCPYYAPFKNHTLYCPVAVSNVTGEITAYSEASWYPGKTVQQGKDKHWGGGSLFVSKNESDRQDGGDRRLSYRKTVPSIDLSSWLRETFNHRDYVILKLDVEGAEYSILRKMMLDGTIHLVDKLYGEYHDDQPTGESEEEIFRIKENLKAEKYTMLGWGGERKKFSDISMLHPKTMLDPRLSPNAGGIIINKCGLTSIDRNQVAMVIEVGMNPKTAVWLTKTVRAYRKKFPCTLFVYGDFVEQNPALVRDWSSDFDIGVRGSSQQPEGVWENLNYEYTQMSIVGAVLRLQKIGIEPIYLLAPRTSKNTLRIAKKRGLWVVEPNAAFPPRKGQTLQKKITSRTAMLNELLRHCVELLKISQQTKVVSSVWTQIYLITT